MTTGEDGQGPSPNQRELQKSQTRKRLLSAARALIESGQDVTLSAVAATAGVSVATAYRYYSDPEPLRIEAGFASDPAFERQLEEQFWAESAGLSDAADLVIVASRILRRTARSDLALYRTFQAIAQHGAARPAYAGVYRTGLLPPFGASRVTLIERAIAPVAASLDPAMARTLLRALVAVGGPEIDLVLRDSLGLGDDEIDEVVDRLLRETVAGHLGRARAERPFEDGADAAAPPTDGAGGP